MAEEYLPRTTISPELYDLAQLAESPQPAGVVVERNHNWRRRLGALVGLGALSLGLTEPAYGQVQSLPTSGNSPEFVTIDVGCAQPNGGIIQLQVGNFPQGDVQHQNSFTVDVVDANTGKNDFHDSPTFYQSSAGGDGIGVYAGSYNLYVSWHDANNLSGSINPNPTRVNVLPCSSGTGGVNTHGGYWAVAGDGGVFTEGTPFYGSTGNLTLNKPVKGMDATPDGKGYWFVASDGGIFSYGDAAFYGSTGNMILNQPIVGMATDETKGGYWLVARDGGVFSFGAPFYGSTGNIRLNQPIVGMAAMPKGDGYYFVASDGGVFNFGNAPFAGSDVGGDPSPTVGIATNPNGAGYWVVHQDGKATPHGGAGDYQASHTINGGNAIGLAAAKDGSGYWVINSDGSSTWYGADGSSGPYATPRALNQPIVGGTAA